MAKKSPPPPWKYDSFEKIGLGNACHLKPKGSTLTTPIKHKNAVLQAVSGLKGKQIATFTREDGMPLSGVSEAQYEAWTRHTGGGAAT